nr:methyl-accepting chemotaxis protein [Bacillus piscicola]
MLNLKFSHKITLITISIIVATVVSLAAFTYQSQHRLISQQMETEAENVLEQLDGDVESYQHTLQIVEDSLKTNYLKLAHSVAETLSGKEDLSVEELQALADQIDIAEIHIMNSEGMLEFSNQADVIGYMFDSSEQSAPFMEAITNKNFEMAQEPTVRGKDGKLAMYAGVATQDKPGAVQIGIEPKEYQAFVDSFDLQEEVQKNSFAETGITFIADKDGVITAHPNEEKVGTPVDKLTFASSITDQENGGFTYDENGTAKYAAFQRADDGTLLLATVNQNDYFGALNELLIQFAITALIIIVVSIILLLLFAKYNISKPIDELKEAMAGIASGDLTSEHTPKRRDEIGEMFNHLNETQHSLRQLIGSISSTSENIASSAVQLAASSDETSRAAEHISQTIQEVASGTEKQSASVEQTTQIVADMSQGVEQITVNAQNVSANAHDTSGKAEAGNQAIQETIKQMNSIQKAVTDLSAEVKNLGDQSNKIGDIIQTITDISGETNLLALNASIEAARAGESGKGFAVVAEEVRKLAEKSAVSAEQITQLISTNKEQTEKAVQTMEATTTEVASGIELVNTAGASFEDIQSATDYVTKQTEEVASAISQIAESAKSIASSIDVISEVGSQSASESQNVSAATEEQLAALEEVSASTASLSEMADELQTLVRNFKI